MMTDTCRYYLAMAHKIYTDLVMSTRYVLVTWAAYHELRSLRVRFLEPHVLGNPPVWLHNGTYHEL